MDVLEHHRHQLVDIANMNYATSLLVKTVCIAQMLVEKERQEEIIN